MRSAQLAYMRNSPIDYINLSNLTSGTQAIIQEESSAAGYAANFELGKRVMSELSMLVQEVHK